MENSHAYDHFRQEVGIALKSKLEEFSLLGYDSVTEDGLWQYLTKKKWRKVQEEAALHEIVSDILSVKVSDFLSFTTMETYKASEFAMDDETEWKELLK